MGWCWGGGQKLPGVDFRTFMHAFKNCLGVRIVYEECYDYS